MNRRTGELCKEAVISWSESVSVIWTHLLLCGVEGQVPYVQSVALCQQLLLVIAVTLEERDHGGWAKPSVSEHVVSEHFVRVNTSRVNMSRENMWREWTLCGSEHVERVDASSESLSMWVNTSSEPNVSDVQPGSAAEADLSRGLK